MMQLLLLPDQFAYVQFHLVVILSMVIAKLLYKPMKFVSLRRYKKIIPVALIFIIWDILVTDVWWQFNEQYVLNINEVLRLPIPIEEFLFFFVVPYGLLTFFENLRSLDSLRKRLEFDLIYRVLLLAKLLLIVSGVYSVFAGWWYTTTISILLVMSDFSVLKNLWVQFAFYFLLITTLIFNFYLTYLPVVLYTESYKSSILIGTIPVEDFGYALVLFLWMLKRAYAGKET